MSQRILVWDLPTRLFHWMLVLNFAGAFYTADSERWRNIHVLCGYTVLGLIVFRLIWGFLGSRYARFDNFIQSFGRVIEHLKCPQYTIGHNPVGALAILSLLLLGICSSLSGWAIYQEVGGDWLEQLHEYSSYIMLTVVLIHIAGVLITSYLQGENLILAMITGKKRGKTDQAISNSHPLLALLLLAIIITFGIMDLGLDKLNKSVNLTLSSNMLSYR